MRISPSVNELLPPRSSSGARSSSSTSAPCSRADSAAHRAALPPPTTITSNIFSSFMAALLLRKGVGRGRWEVGGPSGTSHFPLPTHFLLSLEIQRPNHLPPLHVLFLEEGGVLLGG